MCFFLNQKSNIADYSTEEVVFIKMSKTFISQLYIQYFQSLSTKRFEQPNRFYV